MGGTAPLLGEKTGGGIENLLYYNINTKINTTRPQYNYKWGERKKTGEGTENLFQYDVVSPGLCLVSTNVLIIFNANLEWVVSKYRLPVFNANCM